MTDPTQTSGNDIAIIGMAGRFAGAPDLRALWDNLRGGVESLRRLAREDLAAAGVPASLLDDPNYVPVGAPLPDVAGFDAGFFGFSPLDAAILDPQHRHFLECTWEALEDAGLDPASFGGAVGVFAGSGPHTYLERHLLTRPDLVASVGTFLLRHTGNDKDLLTTRASYLLNLRGPSVNVQTACSTSLVAVHLACQSLLGGESDVALAGGVTVDLTPEVGYLYREGDVRSPDGHCRSFDAAAGGTVFSSGVGVVVLRRLEDALAAGDHVYAVIKATAVNNDGARKVGYLAPSVEGQEAAMAEALALSGVDPETISYVEGHGTATRVGDPIEVRSLTRAFRASTGRTGFCALGSVKSNLGHTDTAAGVAGLIKVALALHHGQVPPTLHFRAASPEMGLETTPFYVSAELRDWPRGPVPRRAAVNSLGVGGTNAFAVLEEAPRRAITGTGGSYHVLPLSARTPEALRAASARLADHLAAHPGLSLADVAHTLQEGRRAFARRRAVVCRDVPEAVQALRALDPARLAPPVTAGAEVPVSFLFAGGGAGHPGMGEELYRREPVYREAVDRCLELVAPHLDFDLRDVLFPRGAGDRAAELRRPSRGLPALFVSQYAQAQLWAAWGVRPQAMLGHSAGEYTAACLAGVMTLADALRVVALRGRLFERVAPGGMSSVPLSPEDLAPLLGADLSLAAVNGPAQCVVSGPETALEALERHLAAGDVEARRVPIGVAAHSHLLDPILHEFAAALREVPLRPPEVPFVSNRSGTWITAGQATDPGYWVEHLRHTVNFSSGLGTLLTGGGVLLEVGPGATLVNLARQHPACGPDRLALGSSPHPKDPTPDLAFMLGTLGQLWQAGVDVRWRALHGDHPPHKLPLPTYPFEHRRHWFDPVAGTAPPPEERRPLDAWFSQPSWARSQTPEAVTPPASARVLALLGDSDLGPEVVRHLEGLGCEVVVARLDPGLDSASTGPGDGAPVVRTGEPEDFARLLAEAEGAGRPLTHVLHLGGVPAGRGEGGLTPDGLEHTLRSGLDSLLHLAQALAGREAPVRLCVVTDRAGQVAGEEPGPPAAATLLGAARVVGAEAPHLTCRAIDVDVPAPGGWRRTRLVEDLARELLSGAAEPVVAYRGRERFVETFTPVSLPGPGAGRLRPGGVYLITGGLGGLGFEVARDLARSSHARLVVVGRAPLPGAEEGRARLAHATFPDETTARWRRLRELEAEGAEVVYEGADVADAGQMRAVVERAVARFGALHGVFHAAGVLDDGLLQLKTAPGVRAVLRPKLEGTLALEEALAGVPLDFLLLFSSVSAVAGLPGQFDYAAANAFLDAYARHARATRDAPVTALGWSAWNGVGMTAPGRRSPACAAPLNEHDWVLDEHRGADGTPVLPGTAYLALARDAFLAGRGSTPATELRDVTFLSPCALAPGETRALDVTLTPGRGGDEAEFVVASLAGPGDRTEHARGRVRVHPGGETTHPPLAGVLGRLPLHGAGGRGREHPHMRFGPRWDSVVRCGAEGEEALLDLALPEAYRADLDFQALHPALLDLATGLAQRLLPGDDPGDLYVPVSYGRLTVLAPLPGRVYSHVRRRSSGGGTQSFDVTVFGPGGEVLVDVADFTMRRVAPEALTVPPPPAGPGEGPPSIAGVRAISPAEGVEVVRRVLGHDSPAQVLVSPQDLPAHLAGLRAAASPDTSAPLAEGETPGAERPELSTPFVEPRGEVQLGIARIWQGALGVSRVGAHDNFFELGGHSLLLTQVVARVRSELRVKLSLSHVFECPTVAEWAQAVALASPAPTSAPATPPQDAGGGDPDAVPFTPSLYRFLQERASPEPHHWNISSLLEPGPALTPELLARAARTLWATHDALRLRFTRPDAGGPWEAHLAGAGEDAGVFTHQHLPVGPDGNWAGALDRAVNEVQGRLDLTRGPLFRAALFSGEDGSARLLLVVHHLVADALSWTILLQDFHAACERLLRGEDPAPPAAPTTSFVAWARDLRRLVASGDLDGDLAVWEGLPWGDVRPLPRAAGAAGRPNTNASARSLTVTLGAAETRAVLGHLPAGTHLEDVLIAALARGLADFTGAPAALLDVLGHGRQEDLTGADLARAVGFFVSYTPLVLSVSPAQGGQEALQDLTRQRRRILGTHSGLSFDLLRTAGLVAGSSLAGLPRAEVLFNYLGHRREEGETFPSPLLRVAAEDSGQTHSPNGLRSYPLAVKGALIRDELTLTYVYSTNLHAEESVRHLAGLVAQALRDLTASPEGVGA